MKIHLINTPDVHPELMDNIMEILESHTGFMKFLFFDHCFSYEDYEFMYPSWEKYYFKNISDDQKKKYITELGHPLSWDEFFLLCESYRQEKKLSDEEIVICITNRRNSLNYFSMYDLEGKRNAFVQASDWDLFLECPQALPIAYEVVANSLQMLLYNTQEKLNKLVVLHEKSLGCMNDYCINKKDIILKLRTADICPNCIKTIQEQHIDPAIVYQAISIFEDIRTQLKFSQGFIGSIEPKHLEIIEKEFIIGDKNINLNALQKTLFLFFLSHLEGVSVNELSDHEEELFDIYQRYKPNADPKSIKDLVLPVGGNFSYNKSRLNTELKNQLGSGLSHFYTVNGEPGKAFKIALPAKYIHIR